MNEEPFAWFWKRLNSYLDRANLKQSKQRNIVIECLLDLKEHISAEDLHQYVRSRNNNTGLATVYRTLNLLKDAGLVEQKHFMDGKSVFEVISPDSHHDHLICTLCERVIEFENDAIERLQEKVAAQFGFRLKDHRLDLFGECLDMHCQYRPK